MKKELTFKNRANYDNSALKLIFLCVIVYFISYIGRKSYDSNINEIMDFYSVDKSSAGLVGTFFFIVYAVGQVVHGILSKYYNAKYSVGGALIVSALANFLMGIMPPSGFVFLKYIWLINGFSMATLWSVMVQVLNRSLAKKHLGQALFIMSFPVAVGTFLSYGISALFSFIGNFKFTFYTAAIGLLAASAAWIFLIDLFSGKSRVEKLEVEPQAEVVFDQKGKKRKVAVDPSFYVLFAVLALFAVVNNFIKDGLTSWTPTILNEKFALANWTSVLLTITLPVFAVIGCNLALFMNKKVKNYIALTGVLYFCSCVFFGALLLFLNSSVYMITIVCFTLVSCVMAGINNLLTSIFPMRSPAGVNAGLVAGLMDGLCYVGSAASSFGLGAIAEATGNWDAVIYLLGGLSVLCVVLCCVCIVLKRSKKRKIAKNA